MNCEKINFSWQKCDGVWDWFGKNFVLKTTTVAWLTISHSIPHKCDKQISSNFCKEIPKYSCEYEFNAWLVKKFDTIRKVDKIRRTYVYVGVEGLRVRVNIYTPQNIPHIPTTISNSLNY